MNFLDIFHKIFAKFANTSVSIDFLQFNLWSKQFSDKLPTFLFQKNLHLDCEGSPYSFQQPGQVSGGFQKEHLSFHEFHEYHLHGSRIIQTEASRLIQSMTEECGWSKRKRIIEETFVGVTQAWQKNSKGRELVTMCGTSSLT